MSGIAGIIHFDGRPVEPGQVEAMTAAMHYRGPDGINHWRRDNVALGQCMLRTTPESLEETQPLTNEDETLVLVMDGRVDNWEELRRELLGKGAVLRTRSDAELVLRAYEVWRHDCLPHIDGDFAMVIWDARRQEAFCARDRLGNKPFFYHWNGTSLVFASEVRPILERSWVDVLRNENKLAEMLADQWYSREETLWKGILRLDAAHTLWTASASVRVRKYWEPELFEALPYRADQEYVEHYRALLTDTVRRLSRSHRPTAYEVSGGLDSSAVMCIAAHLHGSGRLPTPDLSGYTLRFPAGSKADEIGYARAVGAFLGRPIQEVPPTRRKPSWYQEQGQRLRDFPGYPNGVMLRGLYQTAVQEGALALLTGSAGDQWLQGSRFYYEEELRQGRWDNVWKCFQYDATACGFRNAVGWLARYGLYPLLPESLRKTVRRLLRLGAPSDRPLDAYWLSPRLQRHFTAMQARAAAGRRPVQFRLPGQRQLMSALQYGFDVFSAELGERQGALCGLEIRHPFRTYRIAQFAFSTPERLRLAGNVNKFIHVQALQGLMPQTVVQRQDKADFAEVFDEAIGLAELQIRGLGGHNLDCLLGPAGLKRLFAAYRDAPHQGWQNWTLWNAFGVAAALRTH